MKILKKNKDKHLQSWVSAEIKTDKKTLFTIAEGLCSELQAKNDKVRYILIILIKYINYILYCIISYELQFFQLVQFFILFLLERWYTNKNGERLLELCANLL